MADDNLNKQKVENVESNDKGAAAESGEKFRDEIFGAGAAGSKTGALNDSLSNNGKTDKDAGLPKLELGDDKQVDKRNQSGEQGKTSKEQPENAAKNDKEVGENRAKSDKDNSSRDQERNKDGAEVDKVTQQHEFHHGQVNKMPDDAKTNRLDKENSEAGKTDRLDGLQNDAKNDNLGKMGNELKNAHNEDLWNKIGNNMAESSEEIKDGVDELPTGDHIVREDGKESLFTPDGDRITLNPDGSNTIKGDNVKKVETDREGVTTVSFKDGAEVSFDADGFRSVTRGNQGVSFGRMEGHGGGGGKGGGNHSEAPGQPKPPGAGANVDSPTGGKDRNKMSSDERISEDLRTIERLVPGLLEKKFRN